MARRPTLAHRAEYALFLAAGVLARGLPEPAAARLGAALGRLGYWPLGLRRRLVESHLRQAFPERDAAWVRATAAASYAHLGREAVAVLRLAGAPAAEIVARTELEGFERFRAAVEEGRGVVLVSGHLGNWELGAASLAARGIPLDVVVQRQANPLFERALARARAGLGLRVIDRGSAPRAALRALRQGRVVAFVADQDARGAGVFVPFFGRLASTHRGPAVLALRAGSPVFLGLMLRAERGRYRGVLEELCADRSGELAAAAYRIVAAYTARLEAYVRAAPEQYFWHHRRWKTRPPEEPPVPGPV